MRCIIEHCGVDAQHWRSTYYVRSGEAIEHPVHVCDEHIALFDEWAGGDRTRPWRVTKDEDGRLLSIFPGDAPEPSSQFPTRTLVGFLLRRDTQSFIEVAEMKNSAGAWVPVSPIVLRDTGAPIAIEPGDVIDFSCEPVEIEPVAPVVN